MAWSEASASTVPGLVGAELGDRGAVFVRRAQPRVRAVIRPRQKGVVWQLRVPWWAGSDCVVTPLGHQPLHHRAAPHRVLRQDLTGEAPLLDPYAGCRVLPAAVW